jgi:hypothetical protein
MIHAVESLHLCEYRLKLYRSQLNNFGGYQ